MYGMYTRILSGVKAVKELSLRETWQIHYLIKKLKDWSLHWSHYANVRDYSICCFLGFGNA